MDARSRAPGSGSFRVRKHVQIQNSKGPSSFSILFNFQGPNPAYEAGCAPFAELCPEAPRQFIIIRMLMPFVNTFFQKIQNLRAFPYSGMLGYA